MEIRNEKHDEIEMIAILKTTKKVVKLSLFEYRIIREHAPIYTMGSDIPMAYGNSKRMCTGKIEVENGSDFRDLMNGWFDIHLKTKKKGTVMTMLFKDARIEETFVSTKSRNYVGLFLCKGAEGIEEESMLSTNRSWAKRLLEKEY